MKKIYVKDLKPNNSQFQERFLVKSSEIREGNGGKRHLYLTLGDNTTEVAAVKWSLSQKEVEDYSRIEPGMVLAILGKCSEYQGKLQIVIDDIKQPAPETYEMADFIKSAPESSEDMYQYIIDTINSFSDLDFRDLCLNIYTERKEQMLYWPAAKGHHHAEYGGYLWHVKRMVMQGKALCEIYPVLKRDLLLAGIILHDVEKLDEMLSDKYGVVSDYTIKGKMLGHLVMGVEYVGNKCRELLIDKEKTLMLQHMILAHHGQPDFGSPKLPMFPEAEALHHIDMIDARMFTFEEALEFVEPGTMSEKNFSLNNRELYKATFSI